MTSNQEMTTRSVLLSFVKRDKVSGKVDASGILSKECYNTWLSTRRTHPACPHNAYRDAVKKVILGSSRVKPFPADVEANLLSHLRKCRVWPCFEDLPQIKTGSRGWQIKGFHEKQHLRSILGKHSRFEESYEHSEDDMCCCSPAGKRRKQNMPMMDPLDIVRALQSKNTETEPLYNILMRRVQPSKCSSKCQMVDGLCVADPIPMSIHCSSVLDVNNEQHEVFTTKEPTESAITLDPLVTYLLL